MVTPRMSGVHVANALSCCIGWCSYHDRLEALCEHVDTSTDSAEHLHGSEHGLLGPSLALGGDIQPPPVVIQRGSSNDKAEAVELFSLLCQVVLVCGGQGVSTRTGERSPQSQCDLQAPSTCKSALRCLEAAMAVSSASISARKCCSRGCWLEMRSRASSGLVMCTPVAADMRSNTASACATYSGHIRRECE